MTSSHGESDGEGRRALDIGPSLVTGAEDGEDEDEGDDDLDAQGLARIHALSHAGHTQAALVNLWGHALQRERRWLGE